MEQEHGVLVSPMAEVPVVEGEMVTAIRELTALDLIHTAQHYCDIMFGGAQPTVTAGSKIVYDDGRPGHSGVLGIVLQVNNEGMTVQFHDRADTTNIAFADRRWMDFIAIAGKPSV